MLQLGLLKEGAVNADCQSFRVAVERFMVPLCKEGRQLPLQTLDCPDQSCLLLPAE